MSRQEVTGIECYEREEEIREKEGEWSQPLVDELKRFIKGKKSDIKTKFQDEQPGARGVVEQLEDLVRKWELRHS